MVRTGYFPANAYPSAYGNYSPPQGFNPLSQPQPSQAAVAMGAPPPTGPHPVIQRIQDPVIRHALHLLSTLEHLPYDEGYLKSLGINILMPNGRAALDLIQQKNIQVAFGDMGDSLAHAQWIQEQNLMMINQKYAGDSSWPTLFAIAAAIYHEAGHAMGTGDNQSSVQEETNCLALNSMAFRSFQAKYPSFANQGTNSRLINDGVGLYPKLFFNPDPTGIINRIKEKYGQLPLESPGHPVPTTPYQIPLAYRVIGAVHEDAVQKSMWA